MTKDAVREDDPMKDRNGNDAIANVETIYRLDWERDYALGLERVWTAISDENEITAWMRFATRLELRVGGTIHIDFSSQGSLDGVVCNVEAPNLLIYTWGDSLVKWNLEGDGTKTTLRFSHIGVRPELMAGMGAGWHAFLDHLEDHLTGCSRADRYRELKGRYEKEVQS